MQPVDLSIIVVAWNVGPFIGEALESCLWQTHKSIEIIVIQNGSTDDTPQVIASVAGSDPRVTVLNNDTNTGLGPARNQGMAVAKGKYIAFLDGDDWLEPTMAAKAVAAAEEHDADVLIFDYARAFAWGHIHRDCNKEFLRGGLCKTFEEKQVAIQAFGTVWNKLYRRSFIEAEGFHFKNSYYEDIDWTYPIYTVVPRLATLPKTLINYRIREGSILRSYSPRHFEVLERWRCVAEHMDRNRDRIDERWRPVIADAMARQLDSMVRFEHAGTLKQRVEFARGITALVRHMDPHCKLNFPFFRGLRYKSYWNDKPGVAVGLLVPALLKRRYRHWRRRTLTRTSSADRG